MRTRNPDKNYAVGLGFELPGVHTDNLFTFSSNVLSHQKDEIHDKIATSLTTNGANTFRVGCMHNAKTLTINYKFSLRSSFG